MSIRRQFRSRVDAHIRNNWDREPQRSAARLARAYMRVWSNNVHNLGINGETEVMRRLANLGLETLIDVGCHVGVWTDMALAQVPKATVHAFEADPTLSARLVDKYRQDPRVIVNESGMSDVTGTRELFVDADHRDVSSMIHVPDSGLIGVAVPVVRGDEYCRTNGIDRIDYLKIDTEGFDFNIVTGFDSMLGEQIAAIQFEYNEWNVKSRRLLIDFYELLEPHGYRIGKIRPDGVVFADYHHRDETFMGPACLAVHESRPDIQAATKHG